MLHILEILEDHSSNANVKRSFRHHWNQTHSYVQLTHHKVQLILIQLIIKHLNKYKIYHECCNQ